MDYKVNTENTKASCLSEPVFVSYNSGNHVSDHKCCDRANAIVRNLSNYSSVASQESLSNVKRFLSQCKDDSLLDNAFLSVRQNGTVLLDFDNKYFFGGVNIGDKGFSYSIINKITDFDYSAEHPISDYIGIENFYNLLSLIISYGKRAS